MAKPALIAAVLVVAGVAPSWADDAPLAVKPPASVVGNGRTVAPITITGGPAVEGTKPLPVPEVPWITCTGATGLAATQDVPPAVLAPAVTSRTQATCVAHQNGADATFNLTIDPPKAGLYASTASSDVRSTATEVSLDVFAWNGKARTTPKGLRIGSTEGKITSSGDTVRVSLAAGNAPRVLALALASGNQLGAAFVPVTGVTTIPVESEAGASVRVWIAGHWFGPVKTKGKIAKVAIEVPAGVTHGVARSTGRTGYVTDAMTDLKIPALPRIAAVVNRETVRVEEPATIAVAIVGPDGRPAPTSIKVNGNAKRGSVGKAKALAPGLWSVPYTAPTTPGADHVTVKVDGDDKAGTAEIDLDIAAGSVARLELEVSPGPYDPGAAIHGTARAYDNAGNPVTDAALNAALGGTPLTVTPGDPMTIEGTVPERLPEGELAVEVSAGRIQKRAPIKAGGVATTARVGATVDGRQSVAELAIHDKFGNLAREGSFEVAVTGGTMRALERSGRTYRAVVVADPGSKRAHIVVSADGRTIAESDVRFDPPDTALVLGAWASGGWTDNLGVLAGPHGGIGAVLRRGLFGIEVAVLAGVDVMRFSDTTQLVVDGMMLDADRSIGTLGGLMALRARVRLTRRFGVAVTGAVIPMRAHVDFDASAQLMESYDESVLGTRAQLHVDMRIGPGRVFVGGTYGRAKLRDGVVVGRIDGASAIVGYELWLADFGY